jgi:hypothetical protein
MNEPRRIKILHDSFISCLHGLLSTAAVSPGFLACGVWQGAIVSTGMRKRICVSGSRWGDNVTKTGSI